MYTEMNVHERLESRRTGFRLGQITINKCARLLQMEMLIEL